MRTQETHLTPSLCQQDSLQPIHPFGVSVFIIMIFTAAMCVPSLSYHVNSQGRHCTYPLQNTSNAWLAGTQ